MSLLRQCLVLTLLLPSRTGRHLRCLLHRELLRFPRRKGTRLVDSPGPARSYRRPRCARCDGGLPVEVHSRRWSRVRRQHQSGSRERSRLLPGSSLLSFPSESSDADVSHLTGLQVARLACCFRCCPRPHRPARLRKGEISSSLPLPFRLLLILS